jgi:hypothetical protein
LKKRWRSVERERRRTMGEVVEEEDDEDEEEDKDNVEIAGQKESEHGDEEMGDGVQSDKEMRDAGEDEDGGEEDDGSWEEVGSSTHSEHGEDDVGEHVEEGAEAGEHVANNDDDEDQPDDFSEASSLDIPGTIDLDATDETSSIDSYEEARSYDPVKLSKEDVQWIGRSRALAINKEWKGNKKVFLSGRGRYEDHVSLVSSCRIIPRY